MITLIKRICPVCGITFELPLKYQGRLSCGSSECISEMKRRATLRRPEFLKSLHLQTPQWRQKHSIQMKSLYASGQMTSPMLRPEVLSKRIQTIRRLSAEGKLKWSEERKQVWSQRLKKEMAVGLRESPFKRIGHLRTEAEFVLEPLLKPLGWIPQYIIPINPRKGKHPNQWRGLPTYFCPDFFHPETKRCLFIDGSIHSLEEVKIKDIRENQYLVNWGYLVIRIPSAEILANPQKAINLLTG